MIQADNSKSYLRELLRLQNYDLTAISYQQLTVGASVVSLTIPTDARYAILQLESSVTGAAIRYLTLGNNTIPTASTGMIRSNLDVIDIGGTNNLTLFRAIQAAAGTHKLNITYYK